jgi:hypothetical protein
MRINHHGDNCKQGKRQRGVTDLTVMDFGSCTRTVELKRGELVVRRNTAGGLNNSDESKRYNYFQVMRNSVRAILITGR